MVPDRRAGGRVEIDRLLQDLSGAVQQSVGPERANTGSHEFELFARAPGQPAR
jgi:hypothetical protein